MNPNEGRPAAQNQHHYRMETPPRMQQGNQVPNQYHSRLMIAQQMIEAWKENTNSMRIQRIDNENESLKMDMSRIEGRMERRINGIQREMWEIKDRMKNMQDIQQVEERINKRIEKAERNMHEMILNLIRTLQSQR